jgi:hypothetical protein
MPVDDNYTKSLIHFDGNDSSTTFTDSSGKTWTAQGDAHIHTGEKKFGTASGYFGSGQMYSADHDDWYLGTGDFTVDFWLYLIAKTGGQDGYQCFFSQRDSDAARFCLLWHQDGNWTGLVDGSGATFHDSPPTGVWFHLALVRNGSNWYLFRDGVPIDSPQSFNPTIGNYGAVMYISSYNGSVYHINGYIDEWRWSKGIARWTADFSGALPTGPYIEAQFPLCYLHARRDRMNMRGVSTQDQLA